MSIRHLAAIAALFVPPAFAGAATVSGDAPIVILSDEDGRGINIGLQEDAREAFEPAAYSGEQIADEFKRLCLDTAFSPEAFAAAGAQSPWHLDSGTIALPAAGKVGAWEQPVLRSGSVRASLWLGDESGFRKRPILIRTRGALVSGPYGPFKASGKQCNLDLKLSGLSTVDGFVARMNANLAMEPAKLVSKAGFADGHWLLARPGSETVRVSFDAVDLKKEAQLVHVVAQSVPEKKN
jgi:hypothetical protein